MDLTLEITDDYAVRNEIVSQLHGAAIQWLTLAISRAPIEVQSILQVSVCCLGRQLTVALFGGIA